MAFFPTDPSKYRPSKLLLKVEVVREMDRAVQEELGGYTNRHELANDLIEQGLIDLRYPEGEDPVEPSAKSEAESRAGEATTNGRGDAAAVEVPAGQTSRAMPEVTPLADIAETQIAAPEKRGAAVENELADEPGEPMFGMHNRDAPSAWALNRLAHEAAGGPIPLGPFYERTTEDAWKLAAQLIPLEAETNQKLAVMLPRNPDKPQSAAEGFRAFGLGQVAHKPDDQGKLTAWGPFYQWGAAGIVGDVTDPQIGVTESGWQLVEVFDGLDFSLPHNDEIAQRFLAFLQEHAKPDLWGFRTALEGATQGSGRVEINEYFHARLNDAFDGDWKQSVAESVASGYVSRARAWGLIEPKLQERKYRVTPAGEKALDKFSADKAASSR